MDWPTEIKTWMLTNFFELNCDKLGKMGSSKSLSKTRLRDTNLSSAPHVPSLGIILDASLKLCYRGLVDMKVRVPLFLCGWVSWFCWFELRCLSETLDFISWWTQRFILLSIVWFLSVQQVNSSLVEMRSQSKEKQKKSRSSEQTHDKSSSCTTDEREALTHTKKHTLTFPSHFSWCVKKKNQALLMKRVNLQREINPGFDSTTLWKRDRGVSPSL